MKSSEENNRPLSVWATVVTHNRLDMLKNCIEALRLQTRRPDKILVVNNASSDGTQEWLEEQPEVHFITQVNLGSAGGQYTAFKTAYEGGADWVWTMDDDVIADPDALETLLGALDIVPDASFLCSLVESGMEPGLIMNVPEINKRRPKQNYYYQWPKYLGKGLVEIESATFVSLLVSAAAIRKAGYPAKELFIWGDDTEFTQRCASVGEGYLVGESKVKHLRANPARISLAAENNILRIPNYYYLVRNKVYILREKAQNVQDNKLKRCIKLGNKFFLDNVNLAKSSSHFFRKYSTYYRGFWDGLWFAPKIEKPKD